MSTQTFTQALVDWSDHMNGEREQSLQFELFDNDTDQDWIHAPTDFKPGDVSVDFGCKRLIVHIPEKTATTWHDAVDDDMVPGEGLVFHRKFDGVYKTEALMHECLGLAEAGYNSEISVLFWGTLLLLGPEVPISYLRKQDHYLCHHETEWADHQLLAFEKMLTVCMASNCGCKETAAEYLGYVEQAIEYQRTQQKSSDSDLS